jgi:hypothetical protein
MRRLRTDRAAVLLIALTACGARGGAVRTADMVPASTNRPRASEAARPPPHVELQATMDGVCELEDGVVRCAGRNLWGEVGDGAREPRREWSRVAGTEGAVQLAAGGHHVCVRIEDGTARCWGDDAVAQLGDGVGGEPRTAPVPVVGVRDIEEVRAGTSHTCARVRGGDVMCWGGMIDSVLLEYDSDPKWRLHPVRATTNALQLVTGHERTFAKTTDGWATWVPARSMPMPRLLGSLGDVIDLASGIADECAVGTAGEVRCWGASHPSTHPRRYDPEAAQRIAGLPPATRVVVGRAHTCALVAGGNVYCWGEVYGYASQPTAPERVSGVDDAVDLTAGFDFTCARLRTGSVKCWGDTDFLPEDTALAR